MNNVLPLPIAKKLTMAEMEAKCKALDPFMESMRTTVSAIIETTAVKAGAAGCDMEAFESRLIHEYAQLVRTLIAVSYKEPSLRKSVQNLIMMAIAKEIK